MKTFASKQARRLKVFDVVEVSGHDRLYYVLGIDPLESANETFKFTLRSQDWSRGVMLVCHAAEQLSVQRRKSQRAPVPAY